MMEDHVANEQSYSMFVQVSQSLQSNHSALVMYDGRLRGQRIILWNVSSTISITSAESFEIDNVAENHTPDEHF